MGQVSSPGLRAGLPSWGKAPLLGPCCPLLVEVRLPGQCPAEVRSLGWESRPACKSPALPFTAFGPTL